MELDEYSYNVDPTEGSALVQCLRFYYCDAAAKLVDFQPKNSRFIAKKPPVEDIVIDDVVMSQRMEDAAKSAKINPISPGPKFEVVLDEKSAEGETKTSIVDTRCLSDLDSEEELEEAPDLASIGKCPSMVLEVSGMSLHLDDIDSEEDEPRKKSPRDRQTKSRKKSKKKSGDDLSVTSIEFPTDGKKPEPVSPIINRYMASRVVDSDYDDSVVSKESSKKPRGKTEPGPKRKGWLSMHRRKHDDESICTAEEEEKDEDVGKTNTPVVKKRPARSFFGRMRRNKRGEV